MSKNIFVASGTEMNPEQISLIDSIKTASAITPKTSIAAKKSFVPIIIVPAAPTAIITMYNIQDFLLSSRFLTTVDAKNQSASPKQSLLTLERIAADGRKQSYQIIDNPARLSLEDWARVSAVFVHGPAWQFKGWKWDNPVELFENSILPFHFVLVYVFLVCGFYLNFDDATVDPTVASWNVHKLTISRSKRHLDSTAVLKFWETLDRFLLKRG